MKRTYLTYLMIAVTCSLSISQSISPYLFGHNIWLDELNINGTYTDVGSMDELWDDLQVANVKLVRAGGIHYDENIPPYDQYIEWIDDILLIGAEPMMQISRKSTPQEAADLVNYINNTMQRDVKYWIIGNEPDWHWNISTPASNPYHVYDAGTIRDYITGISTAIKQVDSDILVVGPETAWMNEQYLGDLLGGWADITGTDANGNYYLDVVTYHQYNDPDGATVEAKMNTFLGMFDAVNANRPADHILEWAITEFNITTDNDKEGERNKAWSFYAGQYFAEVYGLAMKNGALTITPWSVQESGGARVAFDLGMFDAAPALEPRSAYHHYHMLANHFSGEYADGTSNQNDVHTFGSVSNGITSVIVLNEDGQGYDYSLRLDGTNGTGTQTLKLNVDAGLNNEYTATIAANETHLLQFDASGALIKRCVYNEANAQARSWPTCEVFNVVQSPYNTLAALIPGTIEAEEYDLGGPGVSYSDNDAGNEGGDLRSDDVDIEANANGYNVGWIANDEWLEYTVEVLASQDYLIRAVIASEMSGSFHVEMDGQDVTGLQTVASTDGWQTWDTLLISPVSLTEGEQVMRLYFDAGPFNMDKLIFEPAGPLTNNELVHNEIGIVLFPNPAKAEVKLNIKANWELLNAQSKSLRKGSGDEIEVGSLAKGLYFVRVEGQVIPFVKN